MTLHLLDQFLLETGAAACGPECAIADVTAGATGDLAEFGRHETAMLDTIEFAVGSEGDMIDIEIEAHADGVGRDEIIDLARLVEFDLRVAGAG